MKKSLKMLGATAVFTSLFAMSAFAATKITSVNFYAAPNEDSSMEAGVITEPGFFTDSDQFEISNVNMTEGTSYKSARTFEITLSANGDYYFPDEKEVSVNVKGIESITRKNTDDEYQMTIRLKAYPYYQWNQPDITTDITGTSVKWDKKGAPKVEYIVEWTDKNGEDRSRTGTSTGSTLSLSAYNKEASDKEKEDGKEDSVVTGFAVRAVGTAGDNKNTAPSPWAAVGSVSPDNYDFVTYESWSEVVSSSGSASSGATGSGSSNSGSKAGWQGSGNDWYWRNGNGTYGTGWIWDGQNWYLCDNTGRMQAGWYFDGTNWFYLNEAHDGTYGRMLTGWQNIGGNTFYLNPVSDGTRGAMFVGWRNVDGVNRYFNEAHDGTYGRLIQ